MNAKTHEFWKKVGASKSTPERTREDRERSKEDDSTYLVKKTTKQRRRRREE